MRHAAYLSPSRHGIFYFRWPIPERYHPARKRTDVKISLRTRCPRMARMLSVQLVAAGQSLTSPSGLIGMKYQDIRSHVLNHYRDMLKQFKEKAAENGPLDAQGLEVLRTSLSLAESDLAEWLGLVYEGGLAEATQAFCDRRGIEEKLSEPDSVRLAMEMQNAFRGYASAALEHNDSLANYDLAPNDTVHLPQSASDTAPVTESNNPVVSYMACVDDYINEGVQGDLWVAKTLSEKRDALDLLGKITGNTAPEQLTKAHARDAKAVLIKLPKNRNKDPRTRQLTLYDMLEVPSVSKISTSTINAYLSDFQSFMTWAVNNGHAQQNMFSGTRLPHKTRDVSKQRSAFTTEQLQQLFTHLHDNPLGLVRKDDHKWPALIALFTGARLNEVCQLQIDDIRQHDGVWCFDINDSEGMKKLKNSASRRLIPIHQQLLDIGFVAFLECRRQGPGKQLFPSFAYSPQNGYGRNLGRWFNEKLLPALSMKESNLVFHSLRHSMVTVLSQSDVPDSMVKAILGHEQTGVTHTSYFKSGFKMDQLKREIHKFRF